MAVHAEFGPMVTEVDVDRAVVQTLRTWLPTYLARAERERGLVNRLLARPKPESYANVLDDEEFLDHRLPAIIVTTASTATQPGIEQDGNYSVAWRVVVSSIVRGETPTETRAIAALFGGSVRRVLIQQQALDYGGDGFASEIRWTGSNVAPVADVTPANRYLAAGINEFTVFVDDVVQLGVGPYGPAPDDPYEPPDPNNTPDLPYDPLVSVTGVTVDVNGVPITGS